jgi:PTS system nitrogen regulatory IIA component
MEPLRTRLEKSCFAARLQARGKRAVLEELADLLVSGGAVAADRRADVLAALLDREEKMSTGMQFGVAIPHAKTDKVERLVTAVALSDEGVDFESLDGLPAHIFVATVSPPTDAGAHIRFLADISRQLASRRVRECVLAARSAEEMVAALCDDSNPA